MNPKNDFANKIMVSIYSDDFNKYKFGVHSLGAIRMQICNLKTKDCLKWENQHLIAITKPENRDAKSLHKLIQFSMCFRTFNFDFFLLFLKKKG